MAPSMPLLTLGGSEGQYRVNRPPHFMESTLFPRKSGKNCKIYTFSKDVPCVTGNSEHFSLFKYIGNL
uniref:Uncharacterized protein n=1 Tax=Ursus maritimus TaxID=29073 RepID=A0A452TD57_URSMA